MSKSELRLDWAKHEAAKYACENWHYSRSLPTPPLTRIGIWERGEFVGVVIFSRGATLQLLQPFGLEPTSGCELTRIALRHHTSFVSRIVRLAVAFLKRKSPSLRLIVSHADPMEGHHGGIYQAGNWIFTGTTAATREFIGPNGKRIHGRMVKKQGFTTCYGKRRKTMTPDQCRPMEKPGKYRYLMPLDDAMRVQIAPLAQPYPTRAKQATDANHADGGGAAPTRALQSVGFEASAPNSE